MVMTLFSNRFLNYDVINSFIITEIHFLVEISKFSMLFLHNSHVPQPPIRLERFQGILCKLKLFGSRGGGNDILTMIGVQKCPFIA